MAVPLFDLKPQNAALAGELQAVFARVLASGQFILGPEVQAFERECAAYLGVRHALGISSGTDAILLALMALGIGPGDEVLCPSFTFFATAGGVARTGAKPIFCDVHSDTFNLDVADAARRLSPRTKAILPVHLYGQACDVTAIAAFARQHGLRVIEDAAQAIGATWQGRSVGGFGDFGAFSFFPTKNLGAFGDAGLLTTNDDALAERAALLRTHGAQPKYYHQFVGGNFRLDALQAALPQLGLDDGARQHLLQVIADALQRLDRPVALIQTGVANSMEMTPIEIDGVLFVEAAGNVVQAYDAVSGEELWSFNPTLEFASMCCGPQARGVAWRRSRPRGPRSEGALPTGSMKNAGGQ